MKRKSYKFIEENIGCFVGCLVSIVIIYIIFEDMYIAISLSYGLYFIMTQTTLVKILRWIDNVKR